jgi:PHD/YefM family antitoxin component YafN of YafNO toxin-antitoxin module
MTMQLAVHYITDSNGETTGVIVPIKVWRKLTSETDYLLKSPAMKKRLLEAKRRRKGIPLETVRAKLGI